MSALDAGSIAFDEDILPNGDFRITLDLLILGSGVLSFRKLHFLAIMHRLFDDRFPSEKTSSVGQPLESSKSSFSLSLREKKLLECLLELKPPDVMQESDRGLPGALDAGGEDLEAFDFNFEDSFFTKRRVGLDVSLSGEDAGVRKLVDTLINGRGLSSEASALGSIAEAGQLSTGDRGEEELSRATGNVTPKHSS